MKIKVAFYCGKGTWVNKTIRWWTKSPYSHAELIMPDNKTWIGISPFKTNRLDIRENIDYNKSDWTILELYVTQEQIDVISEFFEATRGSRYDWAGMLLSQFLPYHIKRKNKWYCSEWIAYALRISCVIDWRLIRIYDRADLSPAVLYEIIMASQNGKI